MDVGGAVAVGQPVLLVGEVGVGKTSMEDGVGGHHFYFIIVINFDFSDNGISLSTLNIFRGSSLTSDFTYIQPMLSRSLGSAPPGLRKIVIVTNIAGINLAIEIAR